MATDLNPAPPANPTDHADEVRRGTRFAFGANWARFLRDLDEDRIRLAEDSLRSMLRREDLRGLRFLDVGTGSGLFSLAARRLGATVHSFDFDPQCVACARELRRRYFEGDDGWTIEPGSVLDRAYLERLGRFDVVYAWGVLHHTGAMWQALDNVRVCVAAGGSLFIALYNDQGRPSRVWLSIKRAYVATPRWLRFLIVWPCFLRLWGPTTVRDLVMLRPFRTWRSYRGARGMSPYRDVIDWVGGYPFEVCKPEEVFAFFDEAGFRLRVLKTCAGGHGCNEFVFRRES